MVEGVGETVVDTVPEEQKEAVTATYIAKLVAETSLRDAEAVGTTFVVSVEAAVETLRVMVVIVDTERAVG